MLCRCVIEEDGLSGRAHSPVTMSRWPLDHAGGCQAFGHFLVGGVEDHEENRTSQVQFWDFRRSPVQLIPMTIPRSGKVNVSTAGAVGLSSFGKGTALAVATFQAATVDFYTSAADPFRGSSINLHFTWVAAEADRTGWIDQNWGAYQNVNLITQTDGQLFMVGLHQNDDDEDWMDLYGVNLEGPANSPFYYGGGIFIPSSEGFEVFAVNGDSGDHISGTTIQANHFPAM